MNGADLLVALLKAREVPCVFTLSGNGLNPFYLACRRGGLPIVDFRNEQAASYAADAYAKLTRRLGVCAVSSAVAHVNAGAGLMNAFFDGTPFLLITGASGRERADAGRFQDVEQVPIVASLCKYAKEVDRAERVGFYLHEACARALAGRPGPAHLTIAMDTLNAEVGQPEEWQLRAAPAVVAPLAGPDPGTVAVAADLLQRAERPLLIAGSGVFYAQAGPALHELASAYQIPVQVPIWDRAQIASPTPYFQGVIGAVSGGVRLLEDADLVLMVGAQVDYRTGYLEPPAIGAATKIVRIDVDPAALRQGVEPDLAIHADPRSALVALAAELGRREARPFAAWRSEARRRYQEFRRRWDEPVPAAPMTGRHVVDALRPLLDEETLFLTDGGNIGQWVHLALGNRYPENWLTCGASGVVGWGLGGAIGAKLAFPNKPVVLLSGDGSFGFTVAELETAVRHCLPFVAIVADDRAWGIVKSGQHRQYGDEGVLGCHLGPVRYDLVAEGFGALGLRAERPEEILPAVRRGLASGRPTVVHVPIAHGGPAD